MPEKKQVRVLFVCMGNICRSPTAEGVFRKLVSEQGLAQRFEVDSAGTTAWHTGEAPDARSQEEARRHGVDLSNQRSRGVEDGDFGYFDYILAMDAANMKGLRQRCPKAHKGKLHRLCDFADGLGVDEVPDPYYGGPRGFETVYNIIAAGCRGLLDHIDGRDSGGR